MKSLDLDSIHFVTRHFNDLQGLRHWVPLGLITLGVGVLACPADGPLALLGLVLFLGAFLLMLGARHYYRSTLGEVEPLPAEKLEALSIYSPAGSAPPIAGFPWITPAVRSCFCTMGWALALFLILQAISPAVQIWSDDESLPTLDSVFISKSNGIRYMPRLSTQPVSIAVTSWYSGPRPSKPPLLAQTICVLFGSFFLGIWLWRERHLSQKHYLVLAVLLLGFSALGACLGYFVWEEGEIARTINFFMPVVTLPWMALLLCGASMILAGLTDHWQLVRSLGWSSQKEEL